MDNDGTNNTDGTDGTSTIIMLNPNTTKAALISQIQSNPNILNVGVFALDVNTPIINGGNVYTAIIMRAIGQIINQTEVRIIVFNEGTPTEIAYYLNSQP